MIPIDKKTIIAWAVLFAICIAAVYMLSGKDISDNGNGVDTVRDQLTNAGSEIQSSIDTTREIREGQEQISSAIGKSLEYIKQSRNEDIATRELIVEVRKLNRNSQQILARIRERGPTKEPNH